MLFVGIQVSASDAPLITINVASGTQTQIQAGYPTLSGTQPLVKTGAGTLVVNQPNTISGSMTIQEGVVQLGNAAALASGRVVPLAGGTITISHCLQTTVYGLTPNAGGLVDVGSGMMTVASGLSPIDLVTAIFTGMGDGSWNGTMGITSSAAAASGGTRMVGWLDNGDDSVTFAFAAAGDTNLDWMVDSLDQANFLSSGMFDSGLPANWINGDFTYDGLLDVLDAAGFLSSGLLDTGIYNGTCGGTGSSALVPEPTAWSLALAGLAFGGYSIRRRERAQYG